MNILFSVIALMLYLLAASKLGVSVLDYKSPDQTVEKKRRKKNQALIVGAIALLCNAAVLKDSVFVEHGLNLGFSNAWALISWMIALFILLVAMRKPVENLLIIFFPLAACGLVLILFLPSNRLTVATVALGLKAHIVFSIIAYGTFAVAMCQSVLLAFQDHQLHHKRPTTAMSILPPIQIMEHLLLQLIVAGFAMLNISLIIGFVFVHDIFAQHLVHKTVLSLVAWLIFAVLLWGRWCWGWRGRKISYLTISGFITLTLAFFGSKLVLETILMRV